MGSRKLRGRVMTEAGLAGAEITFDALVEALDPVDTDPDDYLILPGFIDLHVHGGGGGDVMAGEEGVRRAARFHGSHGTTAFVPTTLTAELADLERALLGIDAVLRAPEPDGAVVLGAHLEGPYISSQRLGAQPPATRDPERWEVERLLELTRTRIMTLAPELPGADVLLELLLESDVRPQIGHTMADYAICRDCLLKGSAGVTHLFNAMEPMHHRRGGALGAALAHAQFAEVILDMRHVDAAAYRVAARAIPHLYCVSDAVPCAGMPDGDYRLGPHTVRLQGTSVTLQDDTLAGSALSLDAALRHMVELGEELETAVRRISTFPADYLGLGDRGQLAPGARADIVVMDRHLELHEVFILGHPLAGG